MANQRYPAITESLTEAIGDTPLLRLKKIGADLPANIFVKCEHLNPSGSIKDRMAIKMIEDAELSGKIKPGQHTLIDASAGNTAQALSMWAAIEGYSVKFIMSNAVGKPEKMYPLIRYGAKVELIDIDSDEADILAKGGGLQGARIEVPGNIRCRQEEEQNPNEIFWMRQGLNPSNNSAQEEIGREILTQLDGEVDVFLSAIGTGGTFLGVSHVLKTSNSGIRCIAIEHEKMDGVPDVLSPDRKLIPGINDGITKKIIDNGLADEIIHIGNEEAREMAYRLSQEEGLYVGISSGAIVLTASQVAKREDMAGKNIVTVLVDRGDRNISDERFIT